MAKLNSKPLDIKSEILPINSSRCFICKSPTRNLVDRLAAAGFGPTAIAEEVLGKDPQLSNRLPTLRKNIERHIADHLKIRQKSIRNILENRMKQEGILQEDIETVFVDGKGLLDILIHRGIENASNENEKIYMKDALEAIKIKKELEASEFSEQIKVMEKQVWAITQAIKDILPSDYFQKISLRARQLFEGDVIDLPTDEIKIKELE